MKKNPKNSSVSVQSQLPQKEVTPLSTLTMDELESVQGGARVTADYKVYIWGCRRCDGTETGSWADRG